MRREGCRPKMPKRPKEEKTLREGVFEAGQKCARKIWNTQHILGFQRMQFKRIGRRCMVIQEGNASDWHRLTACMEEGGDAFEDWLRVTAYMEGAPPA
jgi:hypothetical protein